MGYIAPAAVNKALKDRAEAEQRKENLDIICRTPDGDEYLACFYQRAKRAVARSRPNSPFKKLTLEEYTALTWYGGNGFADINGALWSQSPESLTEREDEIKLVLSAINKLPPVTGDFVRCDLVDNEGDALVDEIRRKADRYSGPEILVKGFWSTSLGTDPRFIEKWLDPCLVKVKVRLKGGGADLGKVASNSDEDEILVRAMTRFEIKSKKESLKNGKPFFEIEVVEKK